MGIQINGQTDTISATDGSLNIAGTVAVNVTGDATGLTGTPDITVGTVNASSAVISGDLTVNGTTTTLDTLLTEVDKLEVGANNTNVAVAITQSGSGDILRLYDGATEVFSVTDGGDIISGINGFFYDYSTGKLGVGLDTPGSTRLHVKGHSSLNNSLLIDVNTGDTTLGFAQNGTEKWRIENVTSIDALRFYDVTNTAERLRISSNGNVGIGTDDNVFRLDVSGATSSNPDWGYNIVQIRDNQTNRNGLRIATNTSTDGICQLISATNATPSQFGFWTYNGSSWGERVRISSSGNVGLGLTNPNTRLEISANNNSLGENNTLRFTDTDTSTEANQQIGKIEFYSSDFTTPGAGVKAYIGAFAQDTSPDAYIDFATQDGSGNSNPVTRMRIVSDGRVLIGTTNTPAYTRMLLQGNSTDPTGDAILRLCKGNNTPGTDEPLGTVVFSDSDQVTAAKIEGERDGGTWTSGSSLPTKLVFSTTSNGASSTTERMKILSDGAVIISDGTTWDKYVSDAVFQITHNTNAKLVLNNPGDSTYSIAVGTDSNLSFRNESQSTTPLTIQYANGKIGMNQSAPYADLDITSSTETSTGTLSAHGIRLAAIGSADEDVIPISAGFLSNQDRARAGIGFICKTASAAGYAGAIGFYTRSSADGNGLYRTDEKMRINEGGQVVFGSGSTSAPTMYFTPDSGGGYFVKNTNSTNARTAFEFRNPNGVVGSIVTSASATAYNTSSDYRLKENVVPLTGAADRLNQLQVHRFNFIADPDTMVDGFLAHEAQSVVPEAVTGTHNEVDEEGNPVYQGIDQSKFVPLLTAALQEALAKIETLETRLTALEGQ